MQDLLILLLPRAVLLVVAPSPEGSALPVSHHPLLGRDQPGFPSPPWCREGSAPCGCWERLLQPGISGLGADLVIAAGSLVGPWDGDSDGDRVEGVTAATGAWHGWDAATVR